MGTDCDAGNRNPEVAGNSGCQTFFYTNAQSAGCSFYHDHSMGITRLNVYAGEAAGYVMTNAVETDMIAGTNVSGVNPGLLKSSPTSAFPGHPGQDLGRGQHDLRSGSHWNPGTGPRDPVTGK